MSVVSTLIPRARTPRPRSRYATGALTLALAAGVSAVTVGASAPTHVDHTASDAQRTDAPSGPTAPRATKAPPTTAIPEPTAAPRLIGARSAPVKPAIESASTTMRFSKYPNNLDGWIRESLDVLRKNNIPATYDGIMRNVMRESTGNPRAINLYDSNAAAGIPSKGLLQVIDPTFAAYHVPGTAFDIWNPVSNIVAACNYAAHNYGSMDNVSAAY